jgi:hypothetical protein
LLESTLDSDGKATEKTVVTVTDLVAGLARGVRGAASGA